MGFEEARMESPMAMGAVATQVRGPAGETPKRLDMGSGLKAYEDGTTTVDINPRSLASVLHDLNQVPYPFPDNSFDEVLCRDILEHLEDIPCVMCEIHRIARPGAFVSITTPHFSCRNAFTDPTHRHFFGVHSFDYFTDESQWNFYTPVRFEKVGIELIFEPGLLNRALGAFARRFPDWWERRFAWIFPAWFMHIQLRVRK